jgi:hypothetical protein
MARNRYTNDEVILCAYAAIYDANDFGGIAAIAALTCRSKSSIPMKIRNIACTLDEKGVARHNAIRPLTGKTTGDHGRKTDWATVEPLTAVNRDALLSMCLQIVGKSIG